MKLLLDTHVFLWWIGDSGKLSQSTREVLADSGNEVFLSTVSAWEMAIKARLGKLSISQDLEQFLPSQLQRNAIQVLPIGLSHAVHVHRMPLHHRDPFDRMLIAQAQLESMTLLTADPWIRRYDVATHW